MFKFIIIVKTSINRVLNYYSVIKSLEMSAKMQRHFANRLPDYDKADLDLSDEEIQNAISQITANILTNFGSTDMNAEDGLYLGTAGVSYMFYYLSKVPSLYKMRESYLSSAVKYLHPALNLATRYEKRTKHLPSFMLGNGGVYAVASVVLHATNDVSTAQLYRDKFLRVAPICKNPFLDCGDDEFFVGRAGYLCGALWLAKETDTPLALNDLYDICNAIVTSGRNYSKQHDTKSPLMYSYYKKEYLGAAHGLCSILQMLMTVPGYMDAYPDAATDIKGSVDYLLRLQNKDGNFPCTVQEVGGKPRKEELIHWCHGAPGVVYTMAKAYIIWSDEKYLKSCERCADLIWDKGLLRKGPGICHGVAGNGYVFLLLYRLTEDAKYLHRAKAFAHFMNTSEFRQQARKPDNPFSLYEGTAGTACYLADLLQPEKAAFPFSDIF